jgi:hypothetical protein
VWFIDPVAGLDTNDGITVGTALKTLVEWGNRVQQIHQNVTVTIAAGTVAGALFSTIQTNGFSILILGNVTSSAPDVLAADVTTVSGAAITNAGAVRGLSTATAGAFVDKTRLRVTTGANAGVMAFVTRVVVAGAGGQANRDQWAQATNVRTSNVITNVGVQTGQSYVVDTLNTIVSIGRLEQLGPGRIAIQDCRVTASASQARIRCFADPVDGAGVLFYSCIFPNATLVVGHNIMFMACQMLSSFQQLGGISFLRKCVFCSIVTIDLAKVQAQFNTFDGGSLALNVDGNWDQVGGDLQFVDGTTLNAIVINPFGNWYGHGGALVWGLNNAYTGTTFSVLGKGAWVYVLAPSIPGGATGDCTIGGTIKTYAQLPYNETTTTANNGAGMVLA